MRFAATGSPTASFLEHIAAAFRSCAIPSCKNRENAKSPFGLNDGRRRTTARPVRTGTRADAVGNCEGVWGILGPASEFDPGTPPTGVRRGSAAGSGGLLTPALGRTAVSHASSRRGGALIACVCVRETRSECLCSVARKPPQQRETGHYGDARGTKVPLYVENPA